MKNILTVRAGRVVLLFTNFFLIICALYNLKPASRSLYITELGSANLPYVWIATAVVLGMIITLYHRLVARYSRIHVVLATCIVIIACLLMFHTLLTRDGFAPAFAFYLFVDIMSVILVEQFWSLTNTIYDTASGKRWYGLIATGGLLGGVAGGSMSNALIADFGLNTMQLLLVAAAIIALLMLLTLWMGRLGLYAEHDGVHVHDDAPAYTEGLRAILKHRYLLLIALILLAAQMVEPLVEFQFMKVVESTITGRDLRTAYLGSFFSLLSGVAIAVNLLVTPLVHRFLGALGGLFVQPLAVIAGSFWYMAHATLQAGAFLKISDRGLSYSINRASKELLYIPINPVLIFQAKAWIDMFGYRMFKVLGSVLILLLTQWLPWTIGARQLGWLVLGVCLVWLLVLLRLGEAYRRLVLKAATATPVA
jgi:AAA family ATP:ADP antiporter